MNAVTDVFNNTYLADVLHLVSQGLFIPTLIAIILLLLLTLFMMGQAIVERCTLFRKRGLHPEELVRTVQDASWDSLDEALDRAGLLPAQKEVLTTIARNRALPDGELFAVAQLALEKVRERCTGRLAWSDTFAKIAPLLGLMGTLIPLGPGIVALGQKNVEVLSQSLLVAFDATVCGLICSIVALIISKARTRWYGNAIAVLKPLADCLLEKADAARAAGREEA